MYHGQAVLVTATLLSLLGAAAAVRLSRCGLVRALRLHGFQEDLLRNWVCLVEAESGRDTGVISGPNSDGSHDYGLFQINDRYWCSHGLPGGGCHVRCKELAQDDIAEAAACALLIYSRRGFWAWYGWTRSCRGHRLPDISMCGPRDEPRQYSVLQV